MRYAQENKYDAVCSCGREGEHTWLQNRHSGEAIPDDEPVAIFMAGTDTWSRCWLTT